MSRWEPDAKGRLEQAALSLYQERGYEQTTVTEIAERAGLTERTFFRHFTDKREVIYGLQDDVLKECLLAISTASNTATPIEMIMIALESLVPMLRERHTVTRLRQSVIAANPALQERELLKLAIITRALADALKGRGIPDEAASLAANTGDLVFRTAYAHWLAEQDAPDLSKEIQESFNQLKNLLTNGCNTDRVCP